MNDNEQIAHEQEVMKQLEEFDTPTITNAVATYPALKDMCLGLYNPNQAGWYTDNRLRCFYPELRPRCGYAVTAVYGIPDASCGCLEFRDILDAVLEKARLFRDRDNKRQKALKKTADARVLADIMKGIYE